MTSRSLRIIEGGLDDARVIALLRAHLERARAETAQGSAHALDPSRLRAPGVSFWSVWQGEGDAAQAVAVGALKALAPEHGEVKSMHTAESARGQGIGNALLHHIRAAARARGMTRLSLETGSWPYFAPARALYARHGFTECAPFGDYRFDPNSVFMTLTLDCDPEPANQDRTMNLEHAPVVNAELLIRRPVAEVFAAFVDPGITTRFWFTRSSGPLRPGARVRWSWDMYGVSTELAVLELEQNRRLLIEWDDPPTRVEWGFTPRPDGTTFVSISHSGFDGTGDEVVSQAIDSMGGFSFVLAALKALLEHGVELNLVADHYPDAHVPSSTPPAPQGR